MAVESIRNFNKPLEMEFALNAVAIVQARMGSTRLPGKVLADVAGQPLIQRVVDRVGATPGVDRVVIATTTESADDELAIWCASRGLHVYRGRVDDVLDRYWECAQLHRADYIVRVTADDPLKDPEVVRTALELCESAPEVDYASNTIKPTFPEGLDIEVIRYGALERAANEATLASEREHVTPYIWKRPNSFVLRNFCMNPDLSHWRWTVDRPADLDFVRRIFSQFPDQPLVSYRKVIEWLNEYPENLKINSGTIRNEGYLVSLAKEVDR
jgi:spore coat polysaccharide biosynthesis protein SpsF